MKDVKRLSLRTVFDEHFRIDQMEVRVRLPDEEWSPPIPRKVLVDRDVVDALVFDRNLTHLIFVRQFRAGAYVRDETQPFVAEIVGGKIDSKDKNPQTAMIREIREETGLDVVDIKSIGEVLEAPSRSTRKVYLFAARTVLEARDIKSGVQAGVQGESGEFTQTLIMGVDEVMARLQDGFFPSITTQFALQFLAINKNNLHDLFETNKESPNRLTG